MPVTVERMDDNPIHLSNLNGCITLDDVKTLSQVSESLRESSDEDVYEVVDISAAQNQFPDLLEMFHQFFSQRNDAKRIVFAGVSNWSDFAYHSTRHLDGKFSLFRSVEDAISSISIARELKQAGILGS